MTPYGLFCCKTKQISGWEGSPCIVSVHVASDPTTDLGPGAGVSLNGDGGGKSFVQCFLHS